MSTPADWVRVDREEQVVTISIDAMVPRPERTEVRFVGRAGMAVLPVITQFLSRHPKESAPVAPSLAEAKPQTGFADPTTATSGDRLPGLVAGESHEPHAAPSESPNSAEFRGTVQSRSPGGLFLNGFALTNNPLLSLGIWVILVSTFSFGVTILTINTDDKTNVTTTLGNWGGGLAFLAFVLICWRAIRHLLRWLHRRWDSDPAKTQRPVA